MERRRGLCKNKSKILECFHGDFSTASTYGRIISEKSDAPIISLDPKEL